MGVSVRSDERETARQKARETRGCLCPATRAPHTKTTPPPPPHFRYLHVACLSKFDCPSNTHNIKNVTKARDLVCLRVCVSVLRDKSLFNAIILSGLQFDIEY